MTRRMSTHNECSKTRMERDDSDEGRIVVSLQQHGVFQDGPDTLRNIMNNDLVTPEIQDPLLSAELLGHEQMQVFVARRLCEPSDSDQHLNMKSPIHKNRAKTVSSLYEVVQPCRGKHGTIKVDRNILQRLITAYRSGREVHLENILQHELMTVPLSLATTSGSLHSTNKSVMANILTQHVEVPANITVVEPSCLLIDGQALVMALGKPTDIATFGQYADTFTNTVFRMGANYGRIDVVFDRYQQESIKAGTRTTRNQRHRPVRRMIENDPLVPLPSDWSSFMALEENKADLALMLSSHLIEHSRRIESVVVTARGFIEATTVTKSSDPELDISFLRADHEEADTRHLPPTSDAAKFHIMRSHYQASVWNQAHLQHPDLPPVTEMGWMHSEGQLVPRLLSLPPISKACKEITTCGCTKGCLSQRCSCRKIRMECIEACNCRKLGVSCLNIHGNQS